MANDMNQCSFIGRLGKDPETRYMPSGDAVTNVSIAVGWKTKEKEGVEWVPVVFFGRLAEVAAEYLKKASRIQVTGRFRTQKYEKEGQTHYKSEIVADRMQMLDSKPADGESAERGPRRPESSKPASAAKAPATAGDATEFDDDIPFAWTFAVPIAGLLAAAQFASSAASFWS
ncbi:MAG: single-stranded DNA-binding protein [Gammaproteobacteria bacterium]|nr:single-stranded DNA-binding protein [Gammaproteobacteria bacterium]